MKRLNFWWVLLILLSVHSYAQPKLERLWQTEGLAVPESVLYYHEGRSSFLLVSQVNGDPSAVDGIGGIAQVTLNGELSDAEWITGLNAPKGMASFEGKLYVADITELVIINIKKHAVEKKIPIAGAQFLNDVAIDANGVVYISDTKTNKVYQVKNNVVIEYLDKVDSANGLKVYAGNLVVGAGKTLLLVDKEKHRLPLATGFAQAIDGVEMAQRGEFIVSCWPGLIYYVHASGKIDLLLDSQAEKINTADIDYNSDSQTLYVPNFSKNTITAYHLSMQ
jgi:hypothetical protein